MTIEVVKKKNPRQSEKNKFSKILNQLMAEKKLGVREASRIAGIGASTIVSWRSGSLPEDYIAVKHLAKHFGVSLSYLLTGEDDTRNNETPPSISEVFDEAGLIFDGYAKITIQRIIPKGEKK